MSPIIKSLQNFRGVLTERIRPLSMAGFFRAIPCRIARRDAARKRFEEKRGGPREEKIAAVRERTTAIREKDKATMDMFMQMAKAKYG